MQIRKASIIAIFAAFLLSSCSKVSDFIPLSVDRTLGAQAVEQIDAYPLQFKILDREDHEEAYTRLEKIKNKILNSGKVKLKDDFEWQLKIVQDDSVLNAFCLPGGYIYVYTGLIKFLESEDQLAGILGHEIAHADLRHAVKQVGQQLGLSLLIKLIFGFDNSTLLGIASNLLNLSFSRSHESEADEQSVIFLYNTDYDARGVMRFFEKLEKENKNPQIAEFLSTHPNPENRVENILTKWKKLGGEKGQSFRDEYEKLKKCLP